ncbi:PRC-barrel domain-containing protein [Mycolicibacterium stellerae]|uniref:PRC-barrel domain-containing protein n=1 Tax=Mycolicibacterium stellerae TaxID=2358193 RepID=UPI000F0B4B8C|nr:magnesium transporter [Mycolicibacterium stellerae]
MLLLSRIAGLDVRGSDGRVLGRVADMTAGLGVDEMAALVERILVRRKHELDLLVPWETVKAFKPNAIELTSNGADFAVASVHDALHLDEIWLMRDVLDTQIVDIAGQRLARVADVVLAHRPNRRLELVGVEVGFGAVLRRLGLGKVASRARGDVVAWTDLHLTSERGHAVQLATPRSAIHLLDVRGLAALIARLDIEAATEVLAAKGPDLAAEVIRASHPAVGERILRAMSGAPSALRDRHFLRSRVWPRRRHALREPGP